MRQPLSELYIRKCQNGKGGEEEETLSRDNHSIIVREGCCKQAATHFFFSPCCVISHPFVPPLLYLSSMSAVSDVL